MGSLPPRAPLEETLLSTGVGPRPRAPLVLGRGQAIGRYVVLDHLGEGGMGVVYAAYDPELDRKVAIKLLRNAGSPGIDETDGQTRLLREAQAMAKLTHVNVVTVHDVGTHADSVYVAMEFVDGWTLKGWLEAREPGLPERLEAVLGAGRGLAAAHAKGLVHRDFKPDNVMVGRDGRVLVMDFGLARATRAGPLRDTTDPVGVVFDPSKDALNVELTAVGAVMGTPAYMPPEQHLGAETDARSDQFSFCVAAYEVLYGVRPFRGDSAAALALATTEGMVQPAPPGTRVPSWLRRVLLRGLDPDPDRRWPDMPALLEALSADPTRRRRTVALGLVAVALAGALGGGAWMGRQRTEAACLEAGRVLEQAWSPEVRDELAARMGGLGERGVGTWERLGPLLDDFAGGWSDQAARACRARRVEARWTAERSALADDCLLEARQAFEALVDLARDADASVLNGLIEGATALPRPSACLEDRTLALRIPLPEEPDRRDRVVELRRRLARAEALEVGGRIAEGLAEAQAVREEAESLGYAPLRAEAAYRTGILTEKDGRPKDAEARLEEAVMLGLESGHDEVAARAAVWLARTVGNRLTRRDDGLRWGSMARAIYARLGVQSDPRIGDLEVNVGLVYHQHSELDLAEAHYRRGLAVREESLGPDHPAVAEVVNNLANIHWVRGDLAKALEWHGRARRIRETALGPGHPSVASSFNNLGLVYVDQGDLPAARTAYERSIAITEASLGSEHRLVGLTSGNLGIVLTEQGELDAADDAYDRAMAILVPSLGADNPGVAEVLRGKAEVARRRGELDRASKLLQRALAINVAAYGDDNVDVAAVRIALAELELEAGERERARELLEPSVAVLSRTWGSNHPDTLAARKLLEGIQAGPAPDRSPSE